MELLVFKAFKEDLYEEMITSDMGLPAQHHRSNGTYDTALQLTGFDPGLAIIRNFDFAETMRACTEEKPVLCGHLHSSCGHASYENKGQHPDA